MEGPTYSLTYKGSIPDAIAEARKQKKLFVVYISGEDENYVHLEQSTWADLSVAEAVSKCCIFLHLRQGSVDASQFSAIYPQKSIPSISAIGLNGVMLWQHEGYISAESLVESVEKAWAALHMQETAMTLLTAALASKKPEPLSSPSAAPIEQGVSSRLDAASTSADEPMKYTLASSSTDSKQQSLEQVGETSHDKNADCGEETCLQSDYSNGAKISRDEQSSSATDTSKEALKSIVRDVDSSATCNDVSGSTAPQEKSMLDDNNTMVSTELAGGMTICGPGSSKITYNESEVKGEAKIVDGLTACSSAVKSNDVHLSIRMPNGTSLQTKLTLADTLRSVKSFVDENRVNEIGSYDLAVPYPRKLFNEQDMNRTLSELGFASREALIVVPHRQATRPPRDQPSSYDSRNTESGAGSGVSGGGYFEYVKRVMSYMNPFSYFGGDASSSNSEPSPSAGLWQYRPNPALQNHLSGLEASRRSSFPDHQNPPAGDGASNTRRASRPFGSNIHTLREQEDEGHFDDRNVFWNGNSTQFGGDDRR
ncbi:plant UBX domain-containing protein 11 [Phoenix dactylifera]|uniref:Plant UBX domain-containing protein 11 n=1 Tax=Phoenix dactylifera TaxID=42345 RepID=A0A8B7CR45_PHODC|nr:plant UBX domain-containing protein 11 [Phoenix dactylifera]